MQTPQIQLLLLPTKMNPKEFCYWLKGLLESYPFEEDEVEISGKILTKVNGVLETEGDLGLRITEEKPDPGTIAEDDADDFDPDQLDQLVRLDKTHMKISNHE